MNFNVQEREEPEINLIAMIDVLLVILIFMLVTPPTPNMPSCRSIAEASGSQASVADEQISVAIDATEHYHQ